MGTPKRNFEVIDKDTTQSKLTVSPTRITLKISPRDRDRRDELIAAAAIVAEQIDSPVTLRGRFRGEKDYGGIYMAGKNRNRLPGGKVYFWVSPASQESPAGQAGSSGLD